MSNFIKITFVRYPNSGYGNYTPSYSHEIVNTRIIKRIQKYTGHTTTHIDANTEILLDGDTDWRYCANTYEEFINILVDTENVTK